MSGGYRAPRGILQGTAFAGAIDSRLSGGARRVI